MSQTRQDYISGALDEKIDDVLIKMRELNITGKTNIFANVFNSFLL